MKGLLRMMDGGFVGRCLKFLEMRGEGIGAILLLCHPYRMKISQSVSASLDPVRSRKRRKARKWLKVRKK